MRLIDSRGPGMGPIFIALVFVALTGYLLTRGSRFWPLAAIGAVVSMFLPLISLMMTGVTAPGGS
jgi:hypothetical protein